MVELNTSTSRPGTPFAKELNIRLAGSEPLPNIVLWWGGEYQTWRNGHDDDDDFCGMNFLSENEDSVYCLGLTWTLVGRENLTEDDPNPDMQRAWEPVHQARAALRAAAGGGQAQA
jgi:hypothetical protein